MSSLSWPHFPPFSGTALVDVESVLYALPQSWLGGQSKDTLSLWVAETLQL
jgi:hypothetical protein